jgi:hypothetical protein
MNDMERPAGLSKTHRVLLTLIVLSSAVWIGAQLVRMVIANELFIPGTLDLDPTLLPASELMALLLVSSSSIVVVVSYGVLLISALLFLVRLPWKLKDNGWLTMAIIFFFAFVPVEIYTAVLDIQYIFLCVYTRDVVATGGLQAYAGVRPELLKTLVHRISALSGVPLIAGMSYVTAIIVTVWQPMKRRTAA